MDRIGSHSKNWGGPLTACDSLPVVFSRRGALERLRAALGGPDDGPVLITGEAGSGKTWLARRFASQLPTGWRVSHIDLGAAMNALEFLRLVGHSLGVSIGNRLATARLRCEAALDDEAAEGRKWVLVIDEAHRGAPSVWDEIQAIVNRQGRPGAFAAVLVVGRTSLARDLRAASVDGFAPRLLAHLHLLPLDLDEARELLGGENVTDERLLEELHRDARGNAGMLLRLARTRPELWRTSPAAAPHRLSHPATAALEWTSSADVVRGDDPKYEQEPIPHGSPRVSLEAPSRSAGAALIPSKPPLRIEDGLVEVGWDGDLGSELDLADLESASSEPAAAVERTYQEEPIDDHYATLQARDEQLRNQDRLAALSDESAGALAHPATAEAEETAESDAETESTPTKAESALPASGIRAEGQHEFAPYSQLFNRLRQSKQ
jgi:type II secretory pathway predicted ATPase ExeA